MLSAMTMKKSIGWGQYCANAAEAIGDNSPSHIRQPEASPQS